MGTVVVFSGGNNIEIDDCGKARLYLGTDTVAGSRVVVEAM